MAKRRNITIPDDLDAEVNRLKDQINVSGVCAEALQREVERLQATSVEDQRVVRMLKRFEDNADNWYARGYDFGTDWATRTATRGDLDQVLDTLGDASSEGLLKSFAFDVPGSLGGRWYLPEPEYEDAGPFPKSVEAYHAIELMLWQDVDDYIDSEGIDETVLSDEERDRQRDELYQGQCGNADLGAFLEGFRDAAVELWGKVKPLLAARKRRPSHQETANPHEPSGVTRSDLTAEEGTSAIVGEER